MPFRMYSRTAGILKNATEIAPVPPLVSGRKLRRGIIGERPTAKQGTGQGLNNATQLFSVESSDGDWRGVHRKDDSS